MTDRVQVRAECSRTGNGGRCRDEDEDGAIKWSSVFDVNGGSEALSMQLQVIMSISFRSFN